MIKKVLTISGVALMAGGLFAAGSIYTKASSDWQTNELNKATSEFQQSGQTKASQLVNNASTDINAEIDSQLSDEMKQKQDELNQLIQQYYEMKIQNVTDTQQFKDVESQIEGIKQWAYDQAKYTIDQAFAKQGQ